MLLYLGRLAEPLGRLRLVASRLEFKKVSTLAEQWVGRDRPSVFAPFSLRFVGQVETTPGLEL